MSKSPSGTEGVQDIPGKENRRNTAVLQNHAWWNYPLGFTKISKARSLILGEEAGQANELMS